MQKFESLSELLTPLNWLLGTWRCNEGKCDHPNGTTVLYEEVLTFKTNTDPNTFDYSARSSILSTHTDPVDGAHNHVDERTASKNHQRQSLETGFLKLKPDTDYVTLIVAHNFGVASIEEGRVDAEKHELELRSTKMARTCDSLRYGVESVERKFTLKEDGRLQYLVTTNMEDTPVKLLLNAVFERVGSADCDENLDGEREIDNVINKKDV